METILDKFREVTALLQKEGNQYNLRTDLPFQNVAATLAHITDSNIYILDDKGLLIGMTENYDMDSERFSGYLESRQFPDFYMKYLMAISTTVANIGFNQDETIFPVENKANFDKATTTIIPIFVSARRLGYLILGRLGKDFGTEDLILAEYSATVVGIELLHFNSLREREQHREEEQIKLAISSLSYSEKEAVKYIFKEITTLETRITASKIASTHHITRSVIVNALRKLESSGILETQSMGMKGTLIKIYSHDILKALQEL